MIPGKNVPTKSGLPSRETGEADACTKFPDKIGTCGVCL